MLRLVVYYLGCVTLSLLLFFVLSSIAGGILGLCRALRGGYDVWVGTAPSKAWVQNEIYQQAIEPFKQIDLKEEIENALRARRKTKSN